MGVHRGIEWLRDSYDRSGTWAEVSLDGWQITSPTRLAGGSCYTEADAIRACDWLADLRDGIDLRAQLAAVTAERDEARQERDEAISERNEAFDARRDARAARHAALIERDRLASRERSLCDTVARLKADREAARESDRVMREMVYVAWAERDAARAALAASGPCARVGRMVLGALDRLRGGGK